MKVTSVVTGVLATVAVAAPAPAAEEKLVARSGFGVSNVGINNLGLAFDPFVGAVGSGFSGLGFDANTFAAFNNLQFQNAGIALLFAQNSFDFGFMFQLLQQGFAVNNLASLFQFPAANVFAVEHLIAATQLLTLQWVNGFGVFNNGFGGFGLSGLPFPSLAFPGFDLSTQIPIDATFLQSANVVNLVSPLVSGNAIFDIFNSFNFGFGLSGSVFLKE